MRKTKIICTIGPASENKETLAQMCKAGMNVARLNFSHGTHEEHQKKIDLIKEVRNELKYPLPIMLDTKGPEYRIRRFKNKKAMLTDGQTFTFMTEENEGDETKVSVSYKNLANELKTGDRILVNNGLLIFEVTKIEKGNIITEVISGGEISDCKSMNFPGHVMKGDYLSEQDKDDILFGIKNDIDFIAASFVSSKKDILSLREFLNSNGGANGSIINTPQTKSDVTGQIPSFLPSSGDLKKEEAKTTDESMEKSDDELNESSDVENKIDTKSDEENSTELQIYP